MTGGTVVVLGKTGRNFAAGMSGGVAYVLDLQEIRVNQQMVDLEPLTDDDKELLTRLVSVHAEATDSTVAAELQADWPAALARFTKVMPQDYKRVLRARAQAEAAGADVDKAIMEAAHG
jgi:glutamate synthase (NADPH/NADH) large chain